MLKFNIMTESSTVMTTAVRFEASALAVEAVLNRESAALMATAGSEQKALTEGTMGLRDGSVSARDLYNDFIFIQGEDAAWSEIGHRVPYAWAEAGFQSLGLVVYQKMEGKRGKLVDGFELSARGRRLGVPVAGLMLDISERYPDIALVDLFGSARQGDKSGGFTAEARMGVLYALLESEAPLSTTELANVVFKAQCPGLIETARLRNAIDELEKGGIVTAERFERGETEVTYTQGTQTEPIKFKNRRLGQTSLPLITFKVAKDLVTKNGQATRSEILDQVLSVLPAEETEARGKDVIAELVRKALERISRNGGLNNVTDFSNDKRSKIVLNPKYIDLVRDLKYINDILVSGSEEQLTQLLELGQLYMDTLLADQDRVNNLLQKGKDSSSNHHQLPPQTVIRMISSAIAFGESKDSKELVRIFESQGKPFSRHSVKRLAFLHPDIFSSMGLTVQINEHNQMIINRPYTD